MNTTHHSSARTCAVSRTRRTGGHATPIGPCSHFATAVEEQRVVGACPHALSMRLMQLAVFLAIRGGACPCADGSGWSTPRCSLVRVRVPVRGGDGSPTHPSDGRLPRTCAAAMSARSHACMAATMLACPRAYMAAAMAYPHLATSSSRGGDEATG